MSKINAMVSFSSLMHGSVFENYESRVGCKDLFHALEFKFGFDFYTELSFKIRILRNFIFPLGIKVGNWYFIYLKLLEFSLNYYYFLETIIINLYIMTGKIYAKEIL